MVAHALAGGEGNGFVGHALGGVVEDDLAGLRLERGGGLGQQGVVGHVQGQVQQVVAHLGVDAAAGIGGC